MDASARHVRIDPFRICLPIQLGFAACLLPALVLVPPARGPILLVPIMPGSGSHLAADMIAQGARLVAPGPTRGSLVVDGDRDRIVAGLLRRGVVPMSAVLVDCGEKESRR